MICRTCDSTGNICSTCGESQKACRCPPARCRLEPCEVCGGTSESEDLDVAEANDQLDLDEELEIDL